MMHFLLFQYHNLKAMTTQISNHLLSIIKQLERLFQCVDGELQKWKRAQQLAGTYNEMRGYFACSFIK